MSVLTEIWPYFYAVPLHCPRLYAYGVMINFKGETLKVDQPQNCVIYKPGTGVEGHVV